jgi:hypothetical protein
MKKIFVISLLALSLQYPTIAIAEECMEGDCENGVGTGFTEEGGIYSGEWKDGLPHGTGKRIISKGKHLEGRWEKGKLVEEKNK